MGPAGSDPVHAEDLPSKSSARGGAPPGDPTVPGPTSASQGSALTWEMRDADGVRAFYTKHVHPNVLEPLVAAPGKRYVVLLEEDRIVAAVSLQRRALGIEQVGGLLVVPERRGQGLLRHLRPATDAACTQMGSWLLVGGVYRRAPDVSPIYRALGFRTLIPYIPGAASWGPMGWLARALARLFRVEAGPDAIRIMVGRVKQPS